MSYTVTISGMRHQGTVSIAILYGEVHTVAPQWVNSASATDTVTWSKRSAVFLTVSSHFVPSPSTDRAHFSSISHAIPRLSCVSGHILCSCHRIQPHQLPCHWRKC